MKRLILSALFFTGLALVGLRPAMAVMIGFDPTSPIPVLAGDVLDVDVVVSDLGGQIVSAYDLDITYDPLLAMVNNITFGDALGISNLDTIAFGLDLVGIVDLFEVSFLTDAELDTWQAGGPLTLATIRFDILEDGDLALDFIWDEFNDVKGRDNRVIIPASVPEPGTLLLMAAAIAGLGYSRRRTTA
jgi:hypothetical protein